MVNSSEWWLIHLSGGYSRPVPTSVDRTLVTHVGLLVAHVGLLVAHVGLLVAHVGLLIISFLNFVSYKTETLEKQAANTISWCPTGQFVVLAGLKRYIYNYI